MAESASVAISAIIAYKIVGAQAIYTKYQNLKLEWDLKLISYTYFEASHRRK